MKKTQLISLGILFLIILIGTYVLYTAYENLTDEEKELIKEIDYLPITDLTLVSIVITIAVVFVGLVLLNPFNIVGKEDEGS